VLPRLAARSLLRLEGSLDDPGTLCVVVPDAVRHACLERLRETPLALNSVMNGYRAYFTASAEQALPRLEGRGNGAWLARCEREWPDALHAAASAGTDPAATRLRDFYARFRAARGL
jgi:hypothetical protein